MSIEQLTAFLERVSQDPELQQRLRRQQGEAKISGSGDLEDAVAMAQEIGFEVSKADWLRYQAQQTLAMSDEQLEGLTGSYVAYYVFYPQLKIPLY